MGSLVLKAVRIFAEVNEEQQSFVLHAIGI